MSSSLRVSNLPAGFDSSMLEDMFTMVGNVRNAQVMVDAATGKSKGYGVVEMSTAEEAQDGILHFHGQVKNGQSLVVRENTPHVPVLAIAKGRRNGAQAVKLRAQGRK